MPLLPAIFTPNALVRDTLVIGSQSPSLSLFCLLEYRFNHGRTHLKMVVAVGSQIHVKRLLTFITFVKNLLLVQLGCGRS